MMNADEYTQDNASLKNVAGAVFRHRRAFVLTVTAILGLTLLSFAVDFNTLQQKVSSLKATYLPYNAAQAEAQPSGVPSLGHLALAGFTAIFLGFCIVLLAETRRVTRNSSGKLEAASDSSTEIAASAVTNPAPAQRAPSSITQQAPIEETHSQRTNAEIEHWETLRALAKQLPAAAEPIAPLRTIAADQAPAKIALKPLLRPEPQPESAVILRSTAQHFPLPSVVPNTRSAERPAKPAAKQTVKPAMRTAPVSMAEKSPLVDSESGRASGSNKHAVLQEKLAESWAEGLSQRLRSTFAGPRPQRAGNSGIQESGQAEIAYNPQGKVDYVTYTFNAPAQKKRRRDR